MGRTNALSHAQELNRRLFLERSGAALGSTALGSLFLGDSASGETTPSLKSIAGTLQPRAKRVIYLFQSGAPSQFESFDYKPKLEKLSGQELPESIRQGQRLTTMTSGKTRFRLPIPFSSSINTAAVEPGLASCFPTRPRWLMICASSSLCILKRLTTIPRSRFAKRAFSLQAARAWVPGWRMVWGR